MHPEQPSDPPRIRLDLPTGRVAITDEGEGPLLVAFHGYPGSARDFRWLAPELSAARRLVRVDMPGFGETPPDEHPDVSVDGRGQFAAAVLDALDAKAAVLLGHSLGATTVVSAALLRPERVAALGLLAPVGFEPHWSVPEPRIRSLARMVARPVLGRLMAWPLRRAFAAMGFPSSLTHTQRVQTLRMAGALDFELHLANCRTLTQPCLVAWARDDRLVAPHIIEGLVEVVPEGPRLCFETGGHNLQKTQATEIAEALRCWMPGLSSPAPTP